MSILKIIKLESGTFMHNDSIDGDFFLGRFSFKQELDKAFLVEAYGAKRREYSINEIEVYDFGGTVETFTNWVDLENRLTELGYTGIDTNGIPFTLTETNFGAFSNGLTTEDAIPDAGIFSYTNILGLQVKTTWSNIKAKLKTYLDAFYQVILVSGTNIKTINGTSILGSGDLVVGGGGTSDIVIDMQFGEQTPIVTTERVASLASTNNLLFNTAVTKSGGLLTGPYGMMAKRVLKTSTAKKLTYRYFPDGADLTVTFRIYAFKQNKDSTSIYDCRKLLEKTLTAGGAYTIQKYEFLTADFLDANLIDGEFLAFTIQKTTTLGSLFFYAQDLTLTY